MAKSEPENVTNTLTHLLHRTSQHAEEQFTAAMGPEPLTARQLVVLQVVADMEKPSQVDITERTGIDRSTLADVVRRLSRRGYLTRRRTREDARRYAVKLTDEGRKLLDRAVPLAREADARVSAALSNQQRQQLANALQIILKSASGAQAN